MTAKPPAALADPRQPSALLHILNEVAAALQGASSEKQAFDILRGQLQERGYGSTLALVTEAGDRLAFYATAMQNRTIAALLQQAGRLSGVKAEGRAFELARTPRYQRVIASGQGEFLPDNRQVMGDMLAASFPGAAWPLVGLMVKALRPAPALCVPLRRSGQVRGVWVITAPGLSEADLPVMEAFASQIGAALETGGLVAATQPELQERQGTEPTLRQVVARMEMLQAVDRAIRAAESPETTAAAALAGIRQLVPCVRASVSLFDYSTNQTRVLAVNAAGPSILAEIRAADAKRSSGWRRFMPRRKR